MKNRIIHWWCRAVWVMSVCCTVNIISVLAQTRPIQPFLIEEKDFHYVGPGIISISAVAVNPQDTSIVLLGTKRPNSITTVIRQPDLSRKTPLFKSEDGGTTWHHLALPVGGYGIDNYDMIHQGIDAITFDPSNPEVIYIAAFEASPQAYLKQLFISRDGGTTWFKGNFSAASARVAESFSVLQSFHTSDATTLYYSAEVWSSLQFRPVWNFAKLVFDDTRIQSQEVLYDWQVRDVVFLNPPDRTQMVILKDEDGFFNSIYRQDETGLFKTELGLPQSYKRVLLQDAENPQTLYTAVSRDWYKSEDGALTWFASPDSLPTQTHPIITLPTISILDGITTTREYVIGQGLFGTEVLDVKVKGRGAAGDSLVVLQQNGRFYTAVSYDGGENWHYPSRDSQFVVGLPTGGTNILDNNGHVIRPTIRNFRVAINTSMDYGVTWDYTQYGSVLGFFRLRLSAWAVDPTRPTVLYTGGEHDEGVAILKSIDGGTNWTPLDAPNMGTLRQLVVDPVEPQHIYATNATGRVFGSSRGGLTWSEIALPQSRANTVENTFIAYAPADSSMALLRVTSDEDMKLYKSWDHGASWQEAAELDYVGVTSFATHPTDPFTYYVGTSNDGLVRIQVPNGIVVNPPPENTPPAVENTLEDVALANGEERDIHVFGIQASLFKDADGDSLSYRVESSDDTIAYAIIVNDHLRVVSRGEGSVTITLIAEDPKGEQASLPFTVTVAPAALLGDFNGDGDVAFADFLVFAQGFGKRSGDAGFDDRLDFDASGQVDFADFLQFAALYGKNSE